MEDTREALDRFWPFATDAAGTDRLLALRPEADRPRWAEGLGHPLKSPAAWDGETIQPREQGRQFRAKGEADRDSYFMRQAGMAFRSDDERSAEANECFALAEEYDGQFAKAAAYYHQLGRPGDALRCWWAALDFPAVARLATDPEWANDIRVRAADAVTRPTPPDLFLALLTHRTADPRWCQEAQADPTWEHVLTRLFNRLAEAKLSPSDPVLVDNLAVQIHERVLPLPGRELGLFAFYREDMARAVSHWEVAEWTRAGAYYEAKAHLDPWPARLQWWHKLRRHAQVCEQWQKAPPDPAGLAHDLLWAAFDSAKQAKNIAVAADIATRTAQLAYLKDAFHLAVQLQDAAAAGRIGEQAVVVVARAGDWQAGVGERTPPAHVSRHRSAQSTT